MPRAARKLKSVPKPAGFGEEAQPFAHEEILRGVPARRVQELIDRGVLPAKVVYRVIPERTFKRRLANREILKAAEADAVARLMRVTEAAIKTFGDVEFARKYLSLPVPVSAIKYRSSWPRPTRARAKWKLRSAASRISSSPDALRLASRSAGVRA